jgi:single-stranded-DNA-specific exonuclease
MGDEAQHARFTLSGGGSRASGVAFRTTAAALTKLDGPRDVAVRLELNEWNGVVEPRLVLEGLAELRAAPLEEVGAQEGFWAALTRAFNQPPSPEPVPADGLPARVLRDRRGRGVAGTAGELLSSGERVLLVCADVPRRRAALEGLVAGLGGREGSADASEPVSACSWATLVVDPAKAARFNHLVAIDPQRDPGHVGLLERVSGPGSGALVHLAWGQPEAEFALALARFELDLRAPLAALYRALRDNDGSTEGEALELLLRGDGAHPCAPEACARLLRVLVELDLVGFEPDGEAGVCHVIGGTGRTELERSEAYRATVAERTRAERYLAGQAELPLTHAA